MRSTPPIPAWIRDFRHAGYTNIFQLLPSVPRLYGTETVPGLGDWDAETLLLAKDAGRTGVIGEIAEKEGDDGWRHADRARGDKKGTRTNERLTLLAGSIPGAKLYGSAAANLLFDGSDSAKGGKNSYRQALKDFSKGELHEHLIRVLSWVVSEMPNIRFVACLGNEAWYLTAKAMGNPVAARAAKDYRADGLTLQGVIAGKSITSVAHFHPSSWESNADKDHVGWDILRELLKHSPERRR